MTILAFEFSSERRSVALARDGVVLVEAVEQTDSRATNALGMIEQVMTAAKISREQIEVIAIGLGPGSYTGIRAAIAVAQGWQLARDVKLLGVSSAEALAVQAQAKRIYGRVNVVIDAQRGEFYLATWEITEKSRMAIAPLSIVTATEMESRLAGGETFVGPEQGGTLFPSASSVAQLAAGRIDFTAGEKLEPIYLREANFIKAGPTRSV
jgi:tRNA threonylcarbamoyladenosine biosynthesis protein TsaB